MAHARITRNLEQELEAEQGLSLAEYDVLVQLAAVESRRLRMSELADRLLLSRSGATRLIDRMEANGLVQRVTCEDDRRGQWAALTQAGYDRLRRASPTHLRGVAEHFVERISRDDHPTLARLLRQLTEDGLRADRSTRRTKEPA